MPAAAKFDLKGYKVTKHNSPGSKLLFKIHILEHANLSITYSKILFSASSGRGLQFCKYSAEEISKKKEAERKPEKEFFYTGQVGSVRKEKGSNQKGHEVDQYKEIAEQIMKKIENKDEAGEKWPETVEVSIKQGKEHTEVTWTKRKDKNDFQNGGHF